ncbi:unnamed protein product [Withania somnifera]
MEDFKLSHRRYVNSGQRIGIIHEKAYEVNNIYVTQAYHHNNNNFAKMPSHNNTKYQISKTSYNNNSHAVDHHPNRSWYSKPEFNRKKRVAKYKIYSMEGKVKSSFKNGYRWFKHTCSRIIHGF